MPSPEVNGRPEEPNKPSDPTLNRRDFMRLIAAGVTGGAAGLVGGNCMHTEKASVQRMSDKKKLADQKEEEKIQPRGERESRESIARRTIDVLVSGYDKDDLIGPPDVTVKLLNSDGKLTEEATGPNISFKGIPVGTYTLSVIYNKKEWELTSDVPVEGKKVELKESERSASVVFQFRKK